MSLIAHWDYLTAYLCESCGGVIGLQPEPCANCARPLTKVELVPADSLRGAVKAERKRTLALLREWEAKTPSQHEFAQDLSPAYYVERRAGG